MYYWSLCLSKENVGSIISLLNLLPFTTDLARHTRPVVPDSCDENIGYSICKMNNGEKEKRTGISAFSLVPSYIIRLPARIQIFCYTNISLVLANCDIETTPNCQEQRSQWHGQQHCLAKKT